VPDGQKAYSMTMPIRFEHLQGCIDWWGGAKRKGREETPQAWRVTAEVVNARGYNLDIKNPHTIADDHGDPEAIRESLNAAEAETTSLRDPLKAILAEALARWTPNACLNTMSASPTHPTRLAACAASFSIWPCVASSCRRTRRTNRRRKC
jgi:hypothetical protein